MPNLRSSYINAEPASLADVILELVASDGRSFSLTAAQVVSRFLSAKGSLAQRISATLDGVKQSIADALGQGQVPAELIELEWDSASQRIKNISVR